MAQPTPEEIENVIDMATESFWATVAAAWPTATTGDLGPVNTARFQRGARYAVGEWVALNVPEAAGQYCGEPNPDDPTYTCMEAPGHFPATPHNSTEA